MTRKQIAIVAAIVVGASIASAMVAYRRALRSSGGQAAMGIAPLAPAVSGSPGCADFRDAGSHTGETGCVSGRVLRVFTSRAGNSFVDFCADYRHCPFTSVIFASDHDKFGDLETLRGRQVEIQGTITAYQGHAEIIIHDPQQIRVLP